jgi:large subunit ribosomal protein L13
LRTFSAKPADIKQDWYIVDAEGVVLGRLASQVAQILRGKHKPIFTPHIDTGDFVIVINAEKVRLTGTKEEKKSYFHHTGYPGGGRFNSYKEMIAKHPERVIEKAVKGMIPHNRLGRQILKKLKVYAGEEHPHAAQQPKPLEIR